MDNGHSHRLRGVICAAFMTACCKQAPTPDSTALHKASPLSELHPGGGAPVAPFSFRAEELTPLLAQPAFAPAADALNRGDVSEAASLVAAQLRGPGAGDERYWYLAARLHERSGEDEPALQEYTRVIEIDGLLSNYARLAAAELMIDARRAPQALNLLRQVPEDFAAKTRARQVAVRAAIKAGAPRSAVAFWDARTPRASWQPVGADLAEALLTHGSMGLSATKIAAGSHLEGVLKDAGRIASEVLVRTGPKTQVAKRAKKVQATVERALGAPLQSPTLPVEERLRLIEAKLWQGQGAEAEAAASDLLKELGSQALDTEQGCEAALLHAKGIAMQRKRSAAARALGDATQRCPDDERARSLFLSGRYSSKAGRFSDAIRHHESVERAFPNHRLADDSRIYAALAYKELGDQAKFTRLLSNIAADYPQGDVTPNGTFHLAAHLMERGDWASASVLLEQAERLTRQKPRGHASARGREQYFLGRAAAELGNHEAAAKAWEDVIVRFPLTYYMLHAYTRLHSMDPERAQRALQAAEVSAAGPPVWEVNAAPEQARALNRALSLMAAGDMKSARLELGHAGVAARERAPGVLWAVAQLSANAGALELSHSLVRGMGDWIDRWPSGDWEQAWHLAYPTPYETHVARRATSSGIEPSLAYAVMREESAFNPRAVSSANAYGLMQLVVPTARAVGRAAGVKVTKQRLKQPSVNIHLGCQFLGDLVKRYQTIPFLAIPAYNAGPGRVNRWLKERPNMDFDLWVELIPYKETRNYTKRVLSSQAAYAVLYGKAPPEQAMLLPQSMGE